MLARADRLRKSADFDRVFRSGRAAHGRLLSLRYKPADTLAVGFTAGKMVSDKAVIRNRVQRRLREAVRELAPVGELVVVAKPSAADADYVTLRDELSKLLGQLEVPR